MRNDLLGVRSSHAQHATSLELCQIDICLYRSPTNNTLPHTSYLYLLQFSSATPQVLQPKIPGPFMYTMGQNNQEYRLNYWATRSSVRSFAHSLACGTVNDWMAILSVFFSIVDHSGL